MGYIPLIQILKNFPKFQKRKVTSLPSIIKKFSKNKKFSKKFGIVRNYAYLCQWFTVIHGRFHPRSKCWRVKEGLYPNNIVRRVFSLRNQKVLSYRLFTPHHVSRKCRIGGKVTKLGFKPMVMRRQSAGPVQY